jgi:Mg/Co/Ni transporter MgtE
MIPREFWIGALAGLGIGFILGMMVMMEIAIRAVAAGQPERHAVTREGNS